MKARSAVLLVLISLVETVSTQSFPHRGGQNCQERILKADVLAKNHRARPPMTNFEIQQLAAGNRSSVFESFVAVARDEQTYAKLRGLAIGLPELNADFFNTHAVVLAFLGQRRTSGYDIEISQTSDGHLSIAERTPGSSMVKMVLSAPFKAVAVPIETDRPILLTLATTWRSRLKPYRVTDGQLTITGGFAGISKKLPLEGSLNIIRSGSLATIVFELESRRDKETRRLIDTASGEIDSAKGLRLERVDAFAISGAIQSPFRVIGKFTEDEQQLILNLQTNNSANISDNFSAIGTLKATAMSAPTDQPKH